jgi:hypothetical protein
MEYYALRNDPHESKTFFIKKVVEQAEKEDVILTDTEKEMLDWEDLDPRYPDYWNVELGERFDKEVDKKAYEAKIAILIEHAYQHDIHSDKAAKEQYRNAYLSVRKGNTYISLLVEKGIAKYITRWRDLLGLTYSRKQPNESLQRMVYSHLWAKSFA